ncbi:MAG: RnfABCDGE type electron transport complex subunit A [Bacteroidales bacterium]|nr:RnfABCDGE type electron transport complex subunit A [Bacteroidales bacterium]
MEYIILIITAIFVNNIVLAQFLGICPFLGVSKKVDTAGWMGMAVLFVMLIATLVTYPIYYGILVPYNLKFMQTIVYILVIAALVQTVEIILKKTMPALYSALGVFLPLITTNCTILGVAINVINFEYNLGQSTVYAIATALGFTLAMVLFAGIREQTAITKTPKGMDGTPIALLTAGLLAMAFMGFSGVDKGLSAALGL